MGKKFRWATSAMAAVSIWAAAHPSGAAELQPRSHTYLLSHATLVAAGTVQGVSTGFLSDGRKAVIRLEGVIKGKPRKREIEVGWNDKEFEETAYTKDARVIVFVGRMGADSVYAQVSPGISCWPVEKITLQGKPTRAVEYAYPMDLVTGVPASMLRATEEVEKTRNFQVAKRKQWILADRLLPSVKPLSIPKPRPPKTAKAARPVRKPSSKPKASPR